MNCCILGCEKPSSRSTNKICHKEHIWYFCEQHYSEIEKENK